MCPGARMSGAVGVCLALCSVCAVAAAGVQCGGRGVTIAGGLGVALGVACLRVPDYVRGAWLANY